MNHDSGLIIGIANVSSKPLIELTPKISLKKHTYLAPRVLSCLPSISHSMECSDCNYQV